MTRGPVTASSTRCEMTSLVLPQHANNLGTAFGGQVMAWIDICAAVSAQRFVRGEVVTAAMDELTFRAPVRRGDLVILQAQVNWAGTTSMEVGVRVESEDPKTGIRQHTSTAYLTFVAIDDAGKPTPVPSLLPESDDEKRRFAAAIRRRERRLRHREEDRRLHAAESP